MESYGIDLFGGKIPFIQHHDYGIHSRGCVPLYFFFLFIGESQTVGLCDEPSATVRFSVTLLMDTWAASSVGLL